MQLYHGLPEAGGRMLNLGEALLMEGGCMGEGRGLGRRGGRVHTVLAKLKD